jgi:hypothetical protein
MKGKNAAGSRISAGVRIAGAAAAVDFAVEGVIRKNEAISELYTSQT